MLNIHNWKFQNESFIFLNRKFISFTSIKPCDFTIHKHVRREASPRTKANCTYPHPLATHPRTDRLVSFTLYIYTSETRRFENIHHTMQRLCLRREWSIDESEWRSARSVNLARLQKKRYIGACFTFLIAENKKPPLLNATAL